MNAGCRHAVVTQHPPSAYTPKSNTRNRIPGCASVLHCEIKYKKPVFQYNLYQECGLLSLISRCMRCPVLAWRMLLCDTPY
eukprot:2116739-Rhodomonas_salina.1